MSMSRIAIIGAGLAGLTALQSLRAQGHSVTVFDKSRGSGGRMATKKLGDASWDMGAQFMRAHSEAFTRQLQQWQKAGLISEWPVQPGMVDMQGDAVIAPSADQVTRYVGMPRMTGLSRALLGAANQFVPSVRIVRASYDNGWQLWDDQNNEYGPFDGLIINTPPQQAIPLLSAASQLISLCEQVDMLPCWSLLLTFPEPLQCLPDAVFVHNSPISWMARNSSKPGRNQQQEAWVIHASHEWSRQQVDSARDSVQQLLFNAFNDLLQHQPSATQLHPDNQWLHRWLYAIPANPLDSGFLHDDNTPLALCGDWCHSGSLEGAWLSGSKAADWMHQFLPQ
ncbi:MAG: FAD-dependent oxidoreductase [Oceanospirillaceae bacterium]|nr:FAD-dependent oxidoreductase [Thalassolituus sp.]MAX99075.1 FAD-dependent oxidoreductase [Oceanospirillaceae bacterium]MBL35385.1 FAD-dependent oxidoreductase [Oceanospirillaceae bacterium]MBS53330.1 FAD-dependent oxidoreductase [Oceanospirillaceae bacterium]